MNKIITSGKYEKYDIGSLKFSLYLDDENGLKFGKDKLSDQLMIVTQNDYYERINILKCSLLERNLLHYINSNICTDYVMHNNTTITEILSNIAKCKNLGNVYI
ncbi:MAG: hypothetical protein JKX76_00780 [Colwellia sp.]|nr:hypothetical protein [Colwellia sp.]